MAGRALACLLALAAVAGAAAAQASAPLPASAPPPMMALPTRAAIAPTMDCKALARRDFGGVPGAPTELLTAEIVPASGASAEICRATGYVAPQVQFELRLPTSGYTGRYLQIGCGGNCGYIRAEATPRCDDAMARGGAFAVAATNSGHVGNTLWARDNPALQRDFADRAVHVVSIAAKAIIAAYYGQPAQRAYFQGCSDGGREAMIEAQRHPEDFDGLVAGAPANYITTAFLRFAWQEAKGRRADGAAILTPAALETLHAAVMKACDGADGLVDGEIAEPRQCRFDPATIACAPGAAGSVGCLTGEQVAAARAFYQGPVDERGVHLSAGGLAYGSELAWSGPSRAAGVEGYYRDMIYGAARPGFALKDLAFTAEAANEIRRLGAQYEAPDPDLARFRDRGGRMIVWEGAADPSAGPVATLSYYQDVRDALGGTAKARETMRLFRLPGVYHCRGGYMPYEANFLGAIVNWVEKGEAPDAVIAAAAKPGGGVRTRPIYAYPVAARYTGKGSIDEAANFRGVAPKRDPDDHYDWIGAMRRATPSAEMKR